MKSISIPQRSIYMTGHEEQERPRRKAFEQTQIST